MKESEAQKKICPFITLADSAYNKIKGSDIKAPKCITKECMAWKFTLTHKQELKKPVQMGSDGLLNPMNIDGEELPDGDKEGYCQRLSNV